MRPIVHHIPACPFSQRLEILLELKGRRGEVEFRVVDITKPRDPALLSLASGTTALPVMETERGVLKESLVLLDYLEARFPDPPVARAEPYERAVENMMIAMERAFVAAGYRFVMNQEKARRDMLAADMRAQWGKLDDFLTRQNRDGVFLFDRFGMAEVVFTSIFVRFHFLDYYENWDIPADLARARRWRDACLAHPAAQQVSREEVVKVYYDYAMGAGNGALVEGRKVSSFVFEPDWRARPWPPREKYEKRAKDRELGLA